MPNPALFQADRRRLLKAGAASAVAALSAACAHDATASDRIVDLASGRDLTRADLMQAVRAADLLLLGEQHDNPQHHQRRGALVAGLGAGTVVVAEHLEAGRQVGPGADVRSRLEAAGFDAQAWRWPLHEALFAPLLAAGIPVVGGNAAQTLVRQVARTGSSAWPPALRQALDAAPLDSAGQAALDRALSEGHCGQLPAARVPAMRAAQRTRDASMALALLTALDSGGRPAVLVAGNGHVGLDHGVAQLLRQLRPQARIVSIGFAEPDVAVLGAPYTQLWITPAAQRDDPCADFRLPAPRR